MATKNEKIIGTLLGAGIGGLMSYNRQSKNDVNNDKTNNTWTILKGIGKLQKQRQ